MFKICVGEGGVNASWQEDFPKTTKCVHCGGEARIGFVVMERIPDEAEVLTIVEGKPIEFVCNLHENKPHSMWLHDLCAIAIYFCKECLKTTALYNQA